MDPRRFSTHQESNPCRCFHCYSSLTLSHRFIVTSYSSTKRENHVVRIAYCNLENAGLLFSDCSSEYQGQKRYSRILEHTPFIDICHRIRHRLELKYFHFAQFLLNLIDQLINFRKIRTKTLKFRIDLQDQVIVCWLVTQKMLVY